LLCVVQGRDAALQIYCDRRALGVG
jgi:hypothetical protein